jgi:ASC-1-like (ASCH) protein
MGMIHPSVKPEVKGLIKAKYVFPKDILDEIKKDKTAWKNYKSFSEPYKRIRVAYIDAARDRPEEFRKRLDNFISKTRENKIIGGHGGIDKYYR